MIQHLVICTSNQNRFLGTQWTPYRVREKRGLQGRHFPQLSSTNGSMESRVSVSLKIIIFMKIYTIQWPINYSPSDPDFTFWFQCNIHLYRGKFQFNINFEPVCYWIWLLKSATLFIKNFIFSRCKMIGDRVSLFTMDLYL